MIQHANNLISTASNSIITYALVILACQGEGGIYHSMDTDFFTDLMMCEEE